MRMQSRMIAIGMLISGGIVALMLITREMALTDDSALAALSRAGVPTLTMTAWIGVVGFTAFGAAGTVAVIGRMRRRHLP